MQAAAKSVRVFIVVQTFKQEQVFLKEKVSANERQTHCPLCNRHVIEATTVQEAKIRLTVFVRANDLSIEDGGTFKSRRLRCNERIAIGPIGPVHCVKPHPVPTVRKTY